MEARWTRGDLGRLPALADELVALRPDVIVAVTTTAALAARKATARVPIVAVGPADPVRSGLVASLARPGGNLTGVSPNQAEIAGKWVELVRELVPRARSLAYLTDPGNPGEMLVFGEVEQRRSGLRHPRARPCGRARRGDHDVAARAPAADRGRCGATADRRDLRAAGIPRGGRPAVVRTNLEALFSRAAEHVHRVLQGTPPAELPFEVASTFTLVVNLTTARALGLKLSPAILARADHVIE